ncbi:hydrogenase maturation nickel metallochaperone HypA [Streptomyces scabiei]|uniref:hydrogenase maturation nickel metallochaperone HypA n=1 Tax=Streptomyces scabiei TaxID=1930 RepID=UPI0038F66D50
MHEMSVALAVVDQVAEAADRAGDVTAVRAVRLRVGELAGVVPDALAFSFELACAGTVLEGAELVTEAVPGRARCTPCAHEWAVGMPPRLTCPACGGTRTDLLAGRELQIVDVRWENDGTVHPPTREPISEER